MGIVRGCRCDVCETSRTLEGTDEGYSPLVLALVAFGYLAVIGVVAFLAWAGIHG